MTKRWQLLLMGMWVVVSLAGCALLSQGGGPAKGDGGNVPTVESGLEGLAAGGFIWRREGGIAGFCDIVTVTGDGWASVARCATDPPELIGETELTGDERGQLAELIDRLAPFEHEQSDPATADAMTITIVFTGQGNAQPADDDIAAIERLAQEVLRGIGNP